MILAVLRRWWSRSKTPHSRTTETTDSMFVVPVVAGAPIHRADADTDDTTEAVEGKPSDSSSLENSVPSDATCGASCGGIL